MKNKGFNRPLEEWKSCLQRSTTPLDSINLGRPLSRSFRGILIKEGLHLSIEIIVERLRKFLQLTGPLLASRVGTLSQFGFFLLDALIKGRLEINQVFDKLLRSP